MNVNGLNVIFVIILFFIINVNTQHYEVFKHEKLHHKPATLSNREIRKIASMSNNNDLDEVLDHFLIPRVVGSEGHRRVREYIVSSMRGLGWDVEIDKFIDETPVFGKLEFRNIIARLNPNASRYLALACHYDSKYFKKGKFIGATDSAVPCAQLVDLAFDMEEELHFLKQKNVSLMFIFFDGEEAFENWGPKDSIYGAKHLARKWARQSRSANGISELDRIDILVLLDLIGAPDPNFYNYFQNTEKWYSMLIDAENILANAREFNNYSYGKPAQRYFQPYSFEGVIEDDHIPFLRRDVPILHLIPHPFPEVWHTLADNRQNIDISSVENISKILRVFVSSYLHLHV